MALRVLLSKTNSSWGVQKTGMGEQFYEHVITFDSDDLRWTFLANEMFAGVDPRTLIVQQPQQAFTFIDSNKAIFPVDVKNYPGENYETLLNKDFMIIFDDKINKYTFWAVEGKVKGNRNIIEYDCVRDFAFEIGYNNLFRNDRQVQMERAHVDNVLADDTKTIFTANIGIDSDNFYSENFDEISTKALMPVDEKPIFIDYESDTLKYSNDFCYTANNGNQLKCERAGVLQTTDNQSFIDCVSVGKNFYSLGEDGDIFIYINGELVDEFSKDNNVLSIFIKYRNDWGYIGHEGGSSNDKNFYSFSTIYDKDPIINYGTLQPYFAQIENYLYMSYQGINNEYYFNVEYDDGRDENIVSIVGIYDNNYETLKFWSTANSKYGYIKIDEKSYIVAQGITSNNIYFVNDNYAHLTTFVNDQDFPTTIFSCDRNNKYNIYCKFSSENLTNEFYLDNKLYKTITNAIIGAFCFDGINLYTLQGNDLYKNDDKIDENVIYLHGWIKTPDENSKDYEGVNKILNEYGFSIVNCQMSTTQHGYHKLNIDDKNYIGFPNNPFTIKIKNNKKIDLNYYVMLLPNFSLYYNTPQENSFLTFSTLKSFDDIYERIIKSPDIYNIEPQPFSLIEKNNYNYIINPDNSISLYEKYEGNILLIPSGKITENGQSGSFETDGGLYLFRVFINSFENKLENIYNNQINYITNVNDNFIVGNIGKLKKSPYSQLQIKTTAGTEFTIYPEYINGILDLNISFSWAVDQWHYFIKPLDKNNENEYPKNWIYNNNFQYGSFFQEINNYSYILINTAINNYYINNKSQFNLQARINQRNALFAQIEGGEKIAGGFLGGSLAMIKGNVGAGLAGMVAGTTFGLQQISNAENSVKMQHAMISDLKRTPNQIKGDGSDLNGIINKNIIYPILYKLNLLPSLKKEIGQFLHLFGSNLSHQYKYINDFIGSRYHFNFIKCTSTFENFREDIPLTNATRQIFNKSNANGITIWHYRDPATFKGIKNYDVNNVETKFATL